MGQFKNRQEDRRAKKQMGNNFARPRSYEKISDRVIRIDFGPKPKSVNARTIAERLGGKWHGRSCSVCCPAHDDTTPSLSIAESANGDCLLHCHAGCSYGNIINALVKEHGITPHRTRLRHPTLGTPSKEYSYHDKNGQVQFKICRFNKRDGRKTYRAYIPAEDRWAFPETRSPYNLPHLLKNPQANVLVVEGEKTADAAQRLFPDYVVTTWPGGANADLSKVDFDPLKGRNIAIFADNDEAGKRAASKIQDIVGGEVCFPPTDAPEGWDLADATDEQASSIRPQLEQCFLKESTELSICSVTSLYEKDIPELAYAVGDLYPEGVILLAGRPKIGKSFHMCQLCVAVARGDEFLGRATTKGKVLYISFEDSERRLQKRLKALPRVANGFLDYTLTWPKPSQGGYERLEEAINEHNYKLIVIDTLARFIGINKRGKGAGDGYSDDYETIGRLVDLAHKKRVCLVFVHHLRKAKADDDYFEAVAGSTGLTAAPDTIVVLQKKGVGNKAVLMARGRDVPETILELEMVNGIWENRGNAEELATTSSPIKKKILQFLSDKGGQTPVEIATHIGEKRTSVRGYVRQLVDAGKLVCRNGLYFLPDADNGITA